MNNYIVTDEERYQICETMSKGNLWARIFNGNVVSKEEAAWTPGYYALCIILDNIRAAGVDRCKAQS